MLYLIVGLVMAILIILWGISFYFVKTGRLEAGDWQLFPLGLPQGSVRAILALSFISTLIVSTLGGVTIADLPDWAVGIVGAVVGFYFGARVAQPRKEQPSSPGKDTNEK